MNEVHRDDPAPCAPPRPSSGRLERALDAVAGTVAAGICVLLLSTACEKKSGLQPSTLVGVDLEVGEQSESVTDDTLVDVEIVDNPLGTTEGTASVSTFGTLGGAVAGTVKVTGEDAGATASALNEICYDATHSASPDLSLTNSFRIDRGCTGTGAVGIDVDVSMQKNDGLPFVVFSGSASADCDDADITSNGFASFVATIPGARWLSSQSPLQFPDVVAVEPGDFVKLSIDMTLHTSLAPGASGVYEVRTAQQTAAFDFALAKTSCAVPECSDPAECGLGELCDFGTCRAPTFRTAPVDLAFGTSPSPLLAAEPFSFAFGFTLHENDLQPFAIEVAVPGSALDWVGVAANNQIVGSCSLGPVIRHVLTTLDPDQLYIDLDGNFTFGAADVSVAVTGADPLLVSLLIPNGGDGDPAAHTLPVDATFSCTGFFGMFEAGSPGAYLVDVVATSVDPDTGGADDAAGLDPLQESDEFLLNIPGAPPCDFPSYDIDRNGSVVVSEDGVVIARYLFGFTGSTLVDGALGAGATRTNPDDIVDYLDCYSIPILDVDDNGTLLPMSDGVIVLRHLSLFTGDALTAGVLAPGAERTDPAALGAFMDLFIPEEEP